MTLRIKSRAIMMTQTLTLYDDDVEYCETWVFPQRQRFPYRHIEAVLLSPVSVLSIQVRAAVYSIRTNPMNRHHQQVIDALVQRVQATLGAAPPLVGPIFAGDDGSR